jgi:hypothetical protein
MKSLAFAADAEDLIFLYGFSMPVSPFDRLGSSRSRIVAGGVLARRSLLSLKPESVEKGMRPTMARLTLARKIATITLTMWKKGVGFDPQNLHRQAA